MSTWCVNCHDLDLIREAQSHDPTISRIIGYEKLARKLITQDRQGESPQVKSFMHKWSKLYIDGTIFFIGKQVLKHNLSYQNNTIVWYTNIFMKIWDT